MVLCGQDMNGRWKMGSFKCSSVAKYATYSKCGCRENPADSSKKLTLLTRRQIRVYCNHCIRTILFCELNQGSELESLEEGEKKISSNTSFSIASNCRICDNQTEQIFFIPILEGDISLHEQDVNKI